MKNLIVRTLTGIVFVALLVGCILGGPISFGILFALISALSVNEFCNLVNRSEEVQVNKYVCMLGAVFLFACFFGQSIMPLTGGFIVAYLLIIIYLMISELYLKRKSPLNNWAYAMLSQVYVALPFALLNSLAFQAEPTTNLATYNAIVPLSIFIFTWTNDTGAYCTGMLFGKHRLFERISPKKSWEGSIGGGVFCIVAALVMAHFFPFFSTGVWVGLALVVVVFGTWGDLCESLMKRQLGIKDSGNILPGHGGMLDRFDSSLLAIPAAVLYLYVMSVMGLR